MHSSFHPGTGDVLRSFPASYRTQPKESCEKLVSSQNYHSAPAHQHTQVLYELVIMYIVILLLEFTELLIKLCSKDIVAVHVCKGKLCLIKGFLLCVCGGGYPYSLHVPVYMRGARIHSCTLMVEVYTCGGAEVEGHGFVQV